MAMPDFMQLSPLPTQGSRTSPSPSPTFAGKLPRPANFRKSPPRWRFVEIKTEARWWVMPKWAGEAGLGNLGSEETPQASRACLCRVHVAASAPGKRS